MIRKGLCVVALAGSCVSAMAGVKETISFDVTRKADSEKTEFTACGLNSLYVAMRMGCGSVAELYDALRSGKVLFHAKQRDSWYQTSTSGLYGHWFTTTGAPVASTNSRAAAMGRFENEDYYVAHNPSKLSEGDVVDFTQAFINGGDTLLIEVSLTIGQTESVVADQPNKDETFIHRKDYIDGWTVVPRVRCNEQPYLTQNYIQVKAGETISFGAELTEEDKAKGYSLTYQIKDADNKTIRGYKADDYVIENAEYEDGGYYQLRTRVMDENGKFLSTELYYYFVDVQTLEEGVHFDWSSNTARFSYNFRQEYPDMQPPTKTHNFFKKNGQPANTLASEWWSVHWGDDLNPEVAGNTKNAFTNMLELFEEDFAYIRDYMGWPPDKSPKFGYRSFIYVFGSGLANDNSPNTEMGGYQGYTGADGDGWPCVWASYYPVSRFRDDADQLWGDGGYQRGAMIHEGIHAILADMPGAKNSAWFHEAGNTWLQATMTALRNNSYGVPGFLDACPMIAPFQPIECYSGWLQDGSFGGPAAEGVNMYGENGQICTWRNLLGGTQYGNSFPIVLSHMVGNGSIAWIWRYCQNYVLEGIADSIGGEGMRNLILQYRARQATFDFGGWSEGYRTITDNNMGVTVRAEWAPFWIDVKPYQLTPYQTMTRNSKDHWLAPDTLTTPGWSGGNIIPIHVTGDTVEVEFRPEDLYMRAQLCYRTKDGKAYYSQPAHCGKLSIDITDKPANGIVFCVVANTDYKYYDTNYVYRGESLRKHHYDYRIRLGKGALATADPYQRWYFYERELRDEAFITGIDDVEYGETELPEKKNIRLLSSYIHGGETILLDLNGVNADDVRVRIVGLSGIVVESGRLDADGNYTMPDVFPGMYFITLSHGSQRDVFKCIVK